MRTVLMDELPELRRDVDDLKTSVTSLETGHDELKLAVAKLGEWRRTFSEYVKERFARQDKVADERWTIWQDWHDKMVFFTTRLSNRIWGILAGTLFSLATAGVTLLIFILER